MRKVYFSLFIIESLYTESLYLYGCRLVRHTKQSLHAVSRHNNDQDDELQLYHNNNNALYIIVVLRVRELRKQHFQEMSPITRDHSREIILVSALPSCYCR